MHLEKHTIFAAKLKAIKNMLFNSWFPKNNPSNWQRDYNPPLYSIFLFTGQCSYFVLSLWVKLSVKVKSYFLCRPILSRGETIDSCCSEDLVTVLEVQKKEEEKRPFKVTDRFRLFRKMFIFCYFTTGCPNDSSNIRIF